MIRNTSALRSWVEAAFANGTPEHVRHMLVDAQPHDPVWIHAEAAQAQILANPRARFIAIANLHPGLLRPDPSDARLTVANNEGQVEVSLFRIDP